MLFYFQRQLRKRPARPIGFALIVLLTVGAALLWAHEGHEPLPTRGAKTIENKDGVVTGVILSPEARAALGLKTARVEQRPVGRRILAYASLVSPWQRHAFATSRLAGRIVKLHAKPGTAVKAGAVLAEVKSAELETLQQELLTTRTESLLSAKMLKSLTDSYANGSVSEQSLLDARIKHRQNENARQIARSKWISLGLAEADLALLFRTGKAVLLALPVRAPIGGTVIHADLNVGKVVEPADHLFEIVDPSTVWVRIGVLERDMHRVKIGQTVELTFPAYPGAVFRTTVRLKGPDLDPVTHVNTVWAELKNPEEEPRFFPGLSVQARIVLPGAEKSIAVPEDAVIHDGVESYVLIEGADTPDGSEYIKIPIVPGRIADGWVEVLGGDVYPGSYVVTRGSHQLAGYFIPGVLRPGPEAMSAMGVRLEKVARHRVDRVIEVEGIVEIPPARRSVVSARIAGTLSWLGVDRGDEVKHGQEIARMASVELQSMQLDLLKNHLELELVANNLSRLEKARKSVPARLLWEAESRRNTLKHQHDASRRKLQSLGLLAKEVQALLDSRKVMEYLPIRAAIAGRVVKFDKVLGQALKAEEGIFEIHDPSRSLIRGYVGEADLASFRPGQKTRVRLTADPSFVGNASVIRSDRVFGADNRTLSLWARLDRKPGVPLLHNQLARLTLVRGRSTAGLAVPLAAIVREATRTYVFVRTKDGSFERRAVALGLADDRRIIVTRGLDEGETIAVAGSAALQTAYATIR